MYYQYLNRVIEVPLGGRQKRVDLRLRLVSAAVKQCNTCGSEFLENSCQACGAKFDPTRMKIVKKKAFLILEGIAPEDQTQLEQVGKSFVRNGFLRCNRKDADGKRVCDNHFELSDELLIKQARCHKCAAVLFREEELKKLFPKGATCLRRLRKLQRKRRQLISKGAACFKCGAEVREIPLCCPLCGSCKLGQNLVFLYERRPPDLFNMHQEAASEDDPEQSNEENSEPEDEYPGEVEDDS
jgi:predicted Zn-ribbon and HTH transcriptional regulator